MLNRVRQPFNVNALAQAAAIAALADASYVDSSRALNRAGLAQLAVGLADLGVEFLPSHGNFVLAKVGNAEQVYQRLLAQGVIVRPVANYGLPEWLRISVGLTDENDRFLAALGSALGPVPASVPGR
jgi:histidinol-phosphate aminotransferase